MFINLSRFIHVCIKVNTLKSLKYLCSSLLRNFRKRNEKRLRHLKNELIKEATLKSSKLYFEIAVIAYVLSKITSKPRLMSKEYGNDLRRIEKALRELLNKMGRTDDATLLRIIKEIEKEIKTLEKVDRRFIRDLISKGRLKMAATMYAQGVSLGVASELSGIEKQDIQDYAGNTMMFDRVKEEVSIGERLKKAKKILGG